MSGYLDELNRLMAALALRSDVSATALGDPGSTYLILSDDPGVYVNDDAWLDGFEVTLQEGRPSGGLMSRVGRVAGVPTTFLLGSTSWVSEFADEAKSMAALLFEIHDPRGLIQSLQTKNGVKHPEFAPNDAIAEYGDVSSDFFHLVGLGEATFISNNSTLRDWCDASGVSLDEANSRISEIYRVDVSDLDGGRLIDVFERIRQGEPYRAWRASVEG